MLLNVNESKQGDVLILEIEGRLHGADSAEFQDKIMDMLKARPGRILFDLSGMTRVDSMGLRAFIMTSNKVMTPRTAGASFSGAAQYTKAPARIG